ncbi:MAG: SDR family NAD(P)-dependent oxidoreductase [Pseudomonadales bacterium]
MTLKGKHAVITGAGRGIGAAIVDQLAAADAKVSLLGRNLEPLQTKAAELPGATAIVCDVTDAAAVQSAFAKAVAASGGVDILVNNAGAAESLPFKKTDCEHLQRMLDVNLIGPYQCMQAVVEGMVEKNAGRIINVASTSALKGYRYVSAYAAAKHAILGMSRCLALELADKGVTVNAVCPGFTETDIVRESISNIMQKTGRSEAEALAELAKHNPQQRLIQPEEVAATVLWLCRPEAGAINGQAIAVAGGEVM